MGNYSSGVLQLPSLLPEGYEFQVPLRGPTHFHLRTVPLIYSLYIPNKKLKLSGAKHSLKHQVPTVKVSEIYLLHISCITKKFPIPKIDTRHYVLLGSSSCP